MLRKGGVARERERDPVRCGTDSALYGGAGARPPAETMNQNYESNYILLYGGIPLRVTPCPHTPCPCPLRTQLQCTVACTLLLHTSFYPLAISHTSLGCKPYTTLHRWEATDVWEFSGTTNHSTMRCTLGATHG